MFSAFILIVELSYTTRKPKVTKDIPTPNFDRLTDRAVSFFLRQFDLIVAHCCFMYEQRGAFSGFHQVVTRHRISGEAVKILVAQTFIEIVSNKHYAPAFRVFHHGTITLRAMSDINGDEVLQSESLAHLLRIATCST